MGKLLNKILTKIYNLLDTEESRRFRELNAKYSRIKPGEKVVNELIDDDEEEDWRPEDYDDLEDFERRSLWLDELRSRCGGCSSGPCGPDLYNCSFLSRPLPLDEFRLYVCSEMWNYELSRYIDWDEFREAFPDMETYEWLEDDED